MPDPCRVVPMLSVVAVKMSQLLDITSINKEGFNLNDLLGDVQPIVSATHFVAALAFIEPNADGRVFQPLHVEVKDKNSQALFNRALGFAITLGFQR